VIAYHLAIATVNEDARKALAFHAAIMSLVPNEKLDGPALPIGADNEIEPLVPQVHHGVRGVHALQFLQ
jgi:hypothetical protein